MNFLLDFLKKFLGAVPMDPSPVTLPKLPPLPITPSKPSPLELTVNRKHFFDHDTVGELLVDGVFECYTLEDKVRDPGVKVYGETAIPAGRYKIEVLYWEKHQGWYPHVMNVPNFDGIMIHSGNTDKDTEGCLLVGTTFDPKSEDFIGGSKDAFKALLPKIQEALKAGREVYITYNNVH